MLKYRSWRGVLDKLYVIKFVNDLRQISGCLRLPQPIKLTATKSINEFDCKYMYIQLNLNNKANPQLYIFKK